MIVFRRCGYVRGLVKRWKLEFPYGGRAIQTNTSIGEDVRGMLKKMPNQSGFIHSSVRLGIGMYTENARLYGIPIQNDPDPHYKPNKIDVLLYNMFQNDAERRCLRQRYCSEYVPIRYEGRRLTQLSALNEESRYLGNEAKALNFGKTRKKIPAMASILGMLATLAITVIALVVTYSP